jgi:hypothetical protein
MEMAIAGVGKWLGSENPGTKPPAQLLPSRVRARVSILTCALAEALQRAVDFQKITTEPSATVFASAFGETGPLLSLLEQALSPEGEVSPLMFMYSVHNNASGCLSIARGDQGFTTSIAAGEETFLSALFECYGLLKDGWDSVTLILGDEAPPHFFVPAEQRFESMAVALHLVNCSPSGPRRALPRIRLHTRPEENCGKVPAPPNSLVNHPCVCAYQTACLLEASQSGTLRLAAWGPWLIDVLPPLD